MARVPDALSRLGSDDAEDQEVLQTGADTDGNTAGGIREGSGATSARPGGTSILLGPPRPLHTTLRNSKEVKTELFDQPGPCGAGPASTPPSAFLARSLGHIWPTCGSHYHSQVLRKAIFIHRMVGGGVGVVVSFGGQPCAGCRTEGPRPSRIQEPSCALEGWSRPSPGPAPPSWPLPEGTSVSTHLE